MIKVSVLKNNEVVQFVKFETQAKADAWIQMLTDTGAWGKPERWLADLPLSPLSEGEKILATGSLIIEDPILGTHTAYFFPAEYTIEIEDITAEVEAEEAIQKYMARIQFGQRLMAELAAKNKAELDAGNLTSLQILEIKQALAPVKDFLTEGSTGFALNALQDITVPSLSSETKNYFISKIAEYLAAGN